VVGTQHHYTTAYSALKRIVGEGGVKALWQGVGSSVYRVSVGSAVQLSSYDQSKFLLLSTGLFQDNIYLFFGASLVSGLMVTTFMNPFDVVSTRMYNQKRGTEKFYKSTLDCMWQTLRIEGLRGLYKGWLAHYFRLGPHTILTFVFWEQLRRLVKTLRYEDHARN